MAGTRGLLLAGVAVVLLEALTGAVGLFVLGPAEIVIYLLVCAGATAGVTALAARLIRRGGGEDDESGGGGGGGDEPPPWWPAFERDFWRHVRDRERTPA